MGSSIDPTRAADDTEPAAVRAKEAYYRSLWASVQLRNDAAVRQGTTFRHVKRAVRR